MKTSNIDTGSGNNFSGGMWLHNGTKLKGMLFNLVVNKNDIAPVVLVFRYTLYR
jgi:hypothetical protein